MTGNRLLQVLLPCQWFELTNTNTNTNISCWGFWNTNTKFSVFKYKYKFKYVFDPSPATAMLKCFTMSPPSLVIRHNDHDFIFFAFQIDENVVPLLIDKELSESIAHRGQQVLVRHGCRESPTGTKESTSAVPGPVSRKESLLTMIKSKMADTRARGSGCGLQAKMAMKKTPKSGRPVKFGWSKFDPDRKCFSTVTKKNAGGTSHLQCAKNTGKMDLIKLATTIYDVDSNVEKELSYDSSGAKIVPDDVTVESAYEK